MAPRKHSVTQKAKKSAKVPSPKCKKPQVKSNVDKKPSKPKQKKIKSPKVPKVPREPAM